MNEHNLFYYPYASFTNAQPPLLKVAALYFDKLILLDPVGASWNTIGADNVAWEAVTLLKDAGILEIVTPATVLATYERAITEAILRDMGDRGFLDLCVAESQASGEQHWTLSLAEVPQDVETDQAMCHLMVDIARGVAKDSGQYRERLRQRSRRSWGTAPVSRRTHSARRLHDGQCGGPCSGHTEARCGLPRARRLRDPAAAGDEGRWSVPLYAPGGQDLT